MEVGVRVRVLMEVDIEGRPPSAAPMSQNNWMIAAGFQRLRTIARKVLIRWKPAPHSVRSHRE